MPNPKLLALLPFLVKGALSLQVLREMRRRGFEVTVAFCADASEVYTPDDMEDFRSEGSLIDLTQSLGSGRRETVWDHIERRDIGLILQIGATQLYPFLPSWKERRPRTRIVDTLYNEVGHTLNHFLYERCMDGVIVESEHMLRFIERNSVKEDANIRVVRSGVDTDWLVPPAPPAPREPSLGLRVGYVGRMSPEKNPLGFIDLVERIYRDLPQAEFVLVGQGNQGEQVAERVRSSPVGVRLRYEGYTPDMRVTLQGLDVLVLPSKLDGRPNIVMEANACGVPVIAAPVGGVPELVSEGVNGFLASPTEDGRIADLLCNWQAQPEALGRLKRDARRYAEEHFDRRRMMDDYAESFRLFAGKDA